jgi:hypothetical protein
MALTTGYFGCASVLNSIKRAAYLLTSVVEVEFVLPV